MTSQSKRSYELRLAKLGPDHPSTLTSVYSLAGAYRTAGRVDDSLPLFEKELLSCRKRDGDEHPGTLDSMENLIGVHKQLEKYSQAAKLGQERLSIRRKSLPKDSPALASEIAVLALTML
jgi:hypothetical protein